MNKFVLLSLLSLLLAATAAPAARVAYIDIGQHREYYDNNLMDPGQALTGHVSVKDASGRHTVALIWRDAYNRVAGADTVIVGPPNYAADFAVELTSPLSYYNRLEATLDGSAQPAGVEFFIRKAPAPWTEYYTAVWAGYSYEYFDSLRAAGINTHMVYKDFPYFTEVMAAGFDSYVDNIAWRVFAPYHKWRHRWRTLKEKAAADPYNMNLLIREPSFEDPGTDEKIRSNVQQVVRYHAPHRPIFFNLADEIGIGDQSGPIDLDHSIYARNAFIGWLDAQYGSVDALNEQWGTEFASFYDAARSPLLLTDATMDRIWEKQLPRHFDSPSAAGRRFGVNLPDWDDYVALYARLKSTPPKTAEEIEDMLSRLNGEFGLDDVTAAQLEQYAAKFHDWTAGFEVDVPADWNLSPWMDHKDFMDRSLADALHRAYEYAREVDPEGVFGYTGGHSPAVFAGYNHEYLSRAVDLHVPYNIAEDQEILRSLNKDLMLMSPTWGKDERGVRRLWYQLFHGDMGVIFWDNHEPDNKMIERSTGEMAPRAEVFREDLDELTGGVAELVMASERQHDRIAVLYSHPSIRAGWMVQNLDLGRTWITRESWHEFRTLEANVLRSSLLKLIEDHHYQYDFISYKQLEDGILDEGEYDLLFLPRTIAVSDREVRAIERFVARGGKLVGDNRIGLMDQRGKSRDAGALDHVFGIRWDGREVREGLPNVSAAGAQTRELAGHTVYVNDYGEGTAVYLDRSLLEYFFQRFTPGDDRELYDMFTQMFDLLGFSPPAELTRTDGSRLPATELIRYRNGDAEVWAVHRNARPANYGTDGAVRVESSAFENEERVRLALPNPAHVYDVRNRRYLGRKSELEFTLDPWRPTILTVSPRELPGPRVETRAVGGPGSRVELTIGVPQPSPADVEMSEVVHVRVTDPSGRRAKHYESTLNFSGGETNYRIPFAVSDEKGDWSVSVYHPLSGQSADITHRVD